MSETLALLTKDTSGVFEKGKILRKDVLMPMDVDIEINYAGICHSDLHQGRAEWPANFFYPMVPGHEIAGTVTRVGSEVSKFQVGDRVGVGCFVDSCRNCGSCKDGLEQYCFGGVKAPSEKFNKPNHTVGSFSTYNCCIGEGLMKAKGYPDQIMYGGYSKRIVVDQNYVCAIPQSMDLSQAAPLLCAGITLYSPLVHYGAKAAGRNFKTCIVGLGGLGSMGAKIAKAFGNTVYVASSSENKRDYVENTLGVTFCLTGRTPEGVKKFASDFSNTFDLIVCTISADFDINPYLGTLKPSGTFCLVGLPQNPLPIKPFNFVPRRIKIGGSLIGGIKETQEMLDFCAEHGLYCDTRVIDATKVNYAWQAVTKNEIGAARFVIDMQTLTEESAEVEAAVNPLDHVVHPDANIFGAPNTAGKTYQAKSGAYV